MTLTRPLALGTVATLVSILAVGFSQAQRLPGEYYNEFHFGYETPHSDWATPLAGGKLCAFFIAPTHAARDVTELAQRLDLEPGGETAIYYDSLGDESHYVAQILGTSNEEKKYAILRKLRRPYDVYVLANFPVAKLPIQLQYEILRRVKEGAGLVLTYRREALESMWKHPLEEAAAIAREVPLAGLTFYRTTFLEKMKLDGWTDVAGKLVQGYRLGKGRIVQIDYGIQSPVRIAGGFCLTPHEFYTYRTLTEYDYHQSLVAKALLWAAGREPAVRFEGLPAEGFALPSDASDHALQVKVRNAAAQAVQGKLEVRVRNEWGEKEHETSLPQKLAPGEANLSIDLPQLSGGTHFLDLRLVGDRGVEGWASAALIVASEPRIAKVEMARLSFDRSEPCTGRVDFSAPCVGAGWRLAVTLLDNYGRRFVHREFPVQDSSASREFSLPLEGSVSLAGRARVALHREQTVMDQAEEEFFVFQSVDDDFPALVWGNLPGIFGHFAGVRLHQTGFNTILHYYGEGIHEGRRPSTIAREDFHAVPYVTRINWTDGRLGKIEADAEFAESLRERATQSMPYSPLTYSLGDENFIPSEGGLHENEHEAFVEFLKGRYPTVEALNATWGTQYKTFAEAKPVGATEAGVGREFARYHDSEAFREYLYAHWHHYCREVIRGVDPTGKVGAEGSVPGEMELTIRDLEFWGPYRRTDQNTLLRSLAPRDLLRGNWFGGYNSGRRDPIGLPRFLWETMLDGSTMLEVYCSYTCENFYNTDLTWAPWMEYFLPDLKEVTDGLGQLLARSEHDCDPVAVYHSQPSSHFENLSAPFGRFDDAHRAALRMLEDLSYVPYYVTSRQVEAGILSQKPPRALVMPHAVALSDKEAAALEAYVRGGGTLVADVRPALADGNCNLRPRPALEELFGVERPAGEGKPAKLDVSFEDAAEGKGMDVSLPPMAVPGLTLDSAVNIAAGRPLGKGGETPAFIVTRVGKGAAVLLNFSFHEYRSTPGPNGERPLFELARALFGATGIRPQWQLLDVSGTPLPGGRVSAFTHGGCQILGALPPATENRKAPVPATIIAPHRAHLYDLRASKYLGEADRVKADLRFASATVLSALPYRVTALDVRAPRSVKAGTACEVRMRLRAVGDTTRAKPVIRLTVLGPDGEEQWFYARTLYPEGLEASASIPFALNDTPGQWLIVCRDVLTGTRTTAKVSVEEASR